MQSLAQENVPQLVWIVFQIFVRRFRVFELGFVMGRKIAEEITEIEDIFTGVGNAVELEGAGARKG